MDIFLQRTFFTEHLLGNIYWGIFYILQITFFTEHLLGNIYLDIFLQKTFFTEHLLGNIYFDFFFTENNFLTDNLFGNIYLGCDTCIFFVSMRRFLLTLDSIDFFSLVYSNYCAKKKDSNQIHTIFFLYSISIFARNLLYSNFIYCMHTFNLYLMGTENNGQIKPKICD